MAQTRSSMAAALGREGGLKGGPARAKSLTYKQRAAISRLGGLAAQKKRRAAKRKSKSLSRASAK